MNFSHPLDVGYAGFSLVTSVICWPLMEILPLETSKLNDAFGNLKFHVPDTFLITLLTEMQENEAFALTKGDEIQIRLIQ